MPTVEAPQQQAPMAALPESSPDAVVTKQPTLEPKPDMSPEMSLRGGGFSLGCDCCDGSCRFYKNCC